MSETKIEKLGNYKQQILLLEIGSLIHDVGKLSREFVEGHAQEEKSKEWVYHTAQIDFDAEKAEDEKVRESTKKLLQLLKQTTISMNGQEYDLLNHAIYGHHPKKLEEEKEKEFKWIKPSPYKFKYPKKKDIDYENSPANLINASDNFDSEEDRGKAQDGQSICATYKSNAFGYGEPLDLDYEDERRKVYEQIVDLLNACDIEEVKEKRREFLNNIKKSFEKTLGETQRAANDVSLWEHSYMTASICKALFNWEILQSDFPKGFPHFKEKQDIKNKKPFKILSIGWDYDEFLAQAEKIPDVIGRIEILKEIKDEVKNKIEVEFLLGNCIYEDNYGLHFLIPAVFEENDLIQVVEEIQKIFNENTNGILVPFVNLSKEEGGELTRLLPEAIEELKKKITERDFSFGEKIFKPAWIFDWDGNLPKNKLICSLCGKDFYCEGDEEKICETCKELRKKGRIEKQPQTRFIDEIAWDGKDYGYVGLFTLSFDLRNWLNGEYIQSLFIKNPEKSYDGLKWKSGNNISGLKGLIGGKLKGDFEPTKENKELVQEAVSEKLKEIPLKKGVSSKGIFQRVNGLMEEESSLERFVDNDYIQTIQDKIFNFEYLGEKDKLVKPPSPSRLMRVWNNTKGFFGDLQKAICEKSLLIERHKFEIDEEIRDKGAFEVEFIANNEEIKGEVVFENNYCITVTPHVNSFIEENKHSITEIGIVDERWTEKRKKFRVTKYIGKMLVRGYRIISISPTQLMFLTPASKSIEVLEKIKNKYSKAFGKVYGKLPLNIGIVFGKRKTPIFAAIDSANRFNNMLTELNKKLEFEVSDATPDMLSVCKKDNGTISYTIRKKSKLGNGKQDYYHPYLMVNDERDSIEINLENGEETIQQRHIDQIEKDDRILLHPSSLDFEFLDANKRRFAIMTTEDKRKHTIIGKNGPRPYLLEDLERFQRLKEIFEEIGAWSPIRDVEALAASKRQEWSNNGELGDKKETYRKFIKATLDNKLSRFFDEDAWKKEKSFLLECIMDGSFFDAIELFKTIMKMDLKGGEDV